MDLPLQIGVAVYHLAKLRMLDFYNNFIDKYIDRSDFEPELREMDTNSNSWIQIVITLHSQKIVGFRV